MVAKKERDLRIMDSILGSNPKFLDYTFDENKTEVRLFNKMERGLENYSMALPVSLFSKEVVYIKKEFKGEKGYDEDWALKKVTITDKNTEYGLEDVINIFWQLYNDDKKINQIKLQTLKP